MATDFSKYQAKTQPQSTGTDFSKYGSVTAVQTPEKEPGYFERVLDSFGNLGQQVTGAIEQGAQTYQQGVEKGTFGGTLEATGGLLRSALRTTGAVAEGAFAPIMEAPVIKPLTERVVSRTLEIPGAKELVTKATNVATKYPNVAKDIQNIIDIATLGGGSTAEKPLIQEGRAIASDIAQGAKVLLTPSEEAVQKNVVSLFNKAIKPTAKKTVGQAEKFDTNIVNALRTIKSNVDNLNIEDTTGELITGRAPQTIPELAQALEQTKDSVFKQYDALAKQAGGMGAVIDTKPIAEEVLKVAQNRALQLSNPEIVSYAENWAQRLQGFGQLDTETTQEVIKLMNNNLQSFYKNPSYETASKVAVDAGIANNFRKALDTAIEGATGKEYQALKNQYSALKAIENDVVRASLREGRKNVKGLLDYTDMFTSGQMIGGILSLNPAMFTQGAIERGFKEYIKFLNDPNRAIKNIFEKLDTGASEAFTPTSATGKFLQNPKMGLSIQDVSPAKVAKKMDAEDLRIIRDYLEAKTPDSYIKAQPLFEEIGIDKLPDDLKQRFAQELIDESTKTLKVRSVSGDDTLLQEAKKYKSAEEFVNSNKFYRGEGNQSPTRTTTSLEFGGGKYITKNPEYAKNYGKVQEKFLSPDVNIIDAESPINPEVLSIIQSKLKPINTVDSLIKRNPSPTFREVWKRATELGQDEKVFNDALKQAGYDGISFKAGKILGRQEFPSISLWNENKLLTKSQLTDIWKKANKK